MLLLILVELVMIWLHVKYTYFNSMFSGRKAYNVNLWYNHRKVLSSSFSICI